MLSTFFVVVTSSGTFIPSSDGEMWDVPVTGSWTRNLGPTAHLMTAALSHTGTRSSKHALRSHLMVVESSQVWLMWQWVSGTCSMLPSQDLMFWWKEVKGLCKSWWQHPRDWVLQLDVSIQWHRAPGWLGAAARSMSVSEVCSVSLISPHHCTVANVNLMSCKNTKIC